MGRLLLSLLDDKFALRRKEEERNREKKDSEEEEEELWRKILSVNVQEQSHPFFQNGAGNNHTGSIC